MRERRTKERHHRVSDELLHRAAETLELGTQTLVIRAQNRLDVLRIELLSARGEPDQIGKQHRHDLTLAARLGHDSESTAIDSRSWSAAQIPAVTQASLALSIQRLERLKTQRKRVQGAPGLLGCRRGLPI